MPRLSTIELYKEDMKFSAGHFTIFSSTVRENLHGHNYNLYAAFTTEIVEEGLSFDYRFYKEKLYSLTQSIDETVLLPLHSKHLKIETRQKYYHLFFADEELIFLKRDATLLPVENITVEELSHWFLTQLLADKRQLLENKIQAILVKVFSGPGQAGSANWHVAKQTITPTYA